jgi:hypothetical protein
VVDGHLEGLAVEGMTRVDHRDGRDG